MNDHEADITRSNELDPELELIEGRAWVDWNRGGAIIHPATGRAIGNAMRDLSDETLIRAF